MSFNQEQVKAKRMNQDIFFKDDVFFQAVSVKDSPGLTEINQTIYFRHLPEDKQERIKELILHYNLSSGDGVFSFGHHGNNVSLTFTQKVVGTTLRNKPQGICSTLLNNGMIHLKALLFDSNISEEVICNED